MRILNKLRGRSGLNRLAAILLVLVLALLALFSVPLYRWFRARADAYGCSLALKKAQDMLDEAYMLKGFQDSDDSEARAVVDRSLVGRDALCPAGGDYYIVRSGGREQSVTVVCGIHDGDARLRTRLAADNVLEQLRAEVQRQRDMGNPDPEQLTVTLNGAELTALAAESGRELARGTYYTPEYEGTVAFYTLDKQGVSHFAFADPDHSANWSRRQGWSGDSYPA